MIRDEIITIPDEQLRRGNISADYLVFMDFDGAPKRWWTGWGDLRANGHTWQGIGDMISISGIPMSYKPSADSVTFNISAASQEQLQLAKGSSDLSYGREVTIYMQLFLVAPAEGQPWQPLGPGFSLYSGWMDQLTYKAERDKSGKASRLLRLQAEGVFVRRNAPANGRWTDSDQKRRHPGDKGCERMAIYKNYAPTWTV